MQDETNVNGEGCGSLKGKSCKTHSIAVLVEEHHLWELRKQLLYLNFGKSSVNVSGSFRD